MYKFSEDFVSNCKNPIWLAAQELSYYKVPVFPCKPDKSPKIKNGFKGATKDWATVRKWFQSEDDMIGVPMGNVTCLDIDAKNQPGLVEAFEKSLDDAGLTVIRETLDDLIDRLFAGETLPLVRHLIEDRGISHDELAQLRELIDQLEEESNGTARQ